MSKLLERLAAAREAAAALTAEAPRTTPPVEATTSGKPSFRDRLAAKKAASIPAPAPAVVAAPIAAPAVDKPIKYWANRISGELASGPIKPGFSWKEITKEEFEELVDPAVEVAEAPAEPSASFSLSGLEAAFEAARFTKEEAEEEAAIIRAMVEKEPKLAKVLEESPVPLNSGQLQGAYYALQGKSFVLTGAAGTGKTTAQAATIDILDKEGTFGTHDFKTIGTKPSIAVVAFTKVAVRNIQKAIKKNPRIAHYAEHCMTIHMLLEFQPVIEERRDEDGMLYETRIFRPMRTAANPLKITHLVIEEASMVGLDLFKLLADALLPGVQIIYLGDINQLQPIFSNPILAYALVKLPVIELTRVYRQALDNPIIYNAHEVLKGRPITTSACGKVSVVNGTSPVQIGQSKMALAMKGTIRKLFHAGVYDPEEDQILLPWNKQDLGTKSMNNAVASFLGVERKALVYQVRSSRYDWWLAVGDKVLVDKRVGLITAIQDNPKYIGRACAPPGAYTRDGVPLLGQQVSVDFDATVDAIDYTDFDMGKVAEGDEAARAASHVVTVRWMDDDSTAQLSSAGDFADSKFDFAYAMTVHKAQGSEYRRVFMMIHKDHLGFISREFMYTALTRAREEFMLFGRPDVVEAACLKQEVKGNSLEAKIAYFTSGALQDLDQVEVEFPALEGEG